MSRVSLQDSINPKPLSEGIGEEYPRQAPSVGNLLAQGKSSAVPVTSAAFLLESPTPAESTDPIRCGSFEFVPRREVLHPNPMASSHDAEAVFGGIHFVIDSGGFIRELKESEWVANPVMVPKKDTTALRMCIDYTSLNKHCPKDHFPLPRIDQIVDSTAGCDRLSFLDAYSGYNQIKLKKEDQELTAFITPHGIFCYNVMTFGLKNAGATYQRCMQACLAEQIGRNIEVYIDDIMVKTKHAATLIDDLRETFDNLDRYKIKLNPKKCFWEDKYLGTSYQPEESKPIPQRSKLFLIWSRQRICTKCSSWQAD
ncbi:hypothetical protein QYE76_046852 [Lolium multiflorum]|uniref:Reverse transcriptase domain-containing protein n=1 Tax=Lolium multiflorum TaxID=4521 RepID=A0AAD8TMS7_LOLMU|nr:hypothetical protein QYE76_046852 [Lolium multiflorum]